MLPVTQKKRFETLLTKALDNEITANEQVEFDQLITQHRECMKDWLQYKAMVDTVKTLKFSIPPDNSWKFYWERIQQRLD
jgi:anti-sigma factor RsiW